MSKTSSDSKAADKKIPKNAPDQALKANNAPTAGSGDALRAAKEERMSKAHKKR
jgi:hypothetical protein